LKPLFISITFLLFTFYLSAQRPREVQTQNHFWWSMNTNSKISDHWSLIADFHIRRTNFLANNNFYFVRLGAGYKITDDLTVAAGAGHMWLANRSGATELFSNENRIYQQVQLNKELGKIAASSRLRIEERWQQKVVNFQLTDAYRFTTRFRYQFALTIPVSKNKYVPAIALADEIGLQVGKEIIYNTFDQNRFFAGIKQQLTSSLSFDFGYMLVYQQKTSGYQYSRNNTIRWYFYWKPDLRKKHKSPATAFQLAEE
jgi:long-subunit fatty acid transport protein